jgi:hypothetical protein
MNEETIDINLYNREESDSPDAKDTEMVAQEEHSSALLTDSDSEDFDTDEIENSDDAF